MLEGLPIGEAIKGSCIPGLDLLAGPMDLVSTDVFLADVEDREFLLRSILRPEADEYDFIVIDCPTSLGLLTVNALTSSDYLILLVTPDYLGFEGLLNLMEAVERTREGIGEAAEVLGIVLTLADYHINVKLKEAPSRVKSIFDHDNHSTGADAYRRFSREVVNRIRKDRA
jgi:chromosome partitioning protein